MEKLHFYSNLRYNTGMSRQKLFDPASPEAFKLSRTGIDLFVNCPRCFYLEKRLGIKRPPGFPFTLNSAVDTLLKKEFDIHRAAHTKHPLMAKYGIDAVPVDHRQLPEWRRNFTGIRFLHEPTNLLIYGAIDDLWQNPAGEYIVVDYKSTSKGEAITKLDKEWHEGYKRQMEVYQWLLRQNGFPVSDRGYFVYCNGKTDRKAFDARLEFDITILPYTGKDDWIEPIIEKIHDCLTGETIPSAARDCEYCGYVDRAGKV